jgi:hypothetical protein
MKKAHKMLNETSEGKTPLDRGKLLKYILEKYIQGDKKNTIQCLALVNTAIPPSCSPTKRGISYPAILLSASLENQLPYRPTNFFKQLSTAQLSITFFR